LKTPMVKQINLARSRRPRWTNTTQQGNELGKDRHNTRKAGKFQRTTKLESKAQGELLSDGPSSKTRRAIEGGKL